MRQIAANLKPLLTCPAFYFWHALGAFFCIPGYWIAWTNTGEMVSSTLTALILPAWSAVVMTSLHRDMLSRPFCFCLPGQRQALRKTSFLIGVVASLAACLTVFSDPGFVGFDRVWAAWSYFCFGLILYFSVVGFLFLGDSLSGLMGPFLLFGATPFLFEDLRLLLQTVTLDLPAVNTVLLVVLLRYAWRKMGNAGLSRRAAGNQLLSLQMLWRRDAAEEYQEIENREATPGENWKLRKRLLEVLSNRIELRPALSFSRHLTATQFELAGGQLPKSAPSVRVVGLIAIIALVYIGYSGSDDPSWANTEANLVYLAVCLLSFYLAAPVFTSMLLPAGRKERFQTSISIAACYGVFIFSLAFLLYLVFVVLSQVAPPLTIKGEVHNFQHAHLKPAFLPLVSLPLNLILKVVCRRWLLVPEIILFLILLTIGIPWINGLNPFAIAALLLLNWGMLFGVLYTYHFRRDLILE